MSGDQREIDRREWLRARGAEREQWERDDETEGKAIARAAEPDVEDEL
jgi:hypothetical protein